MTRCPSDAEAGGLSPLSRDVLHLLGRGATMLQIAERLALPCHEVEAQIALLQARFGAADRRALRVRVILTQGRE